MEKTPVLFFRTKMSIQKVSATVKTPLNSLRRAFPAKCTADLV